MNRHSGATDISTSAHQIIQFVFPARSMQLCEQPLNVNQFWVQDRINVDKLGEDRLKEEIYQVMERLSGNKAINILNNENFDSIYSALFYLQEVSLTVRKEIIQILEQGLRNIIKQMERTHLLEWAEQNYINQDSINQAHEDPNLKMALQIKNALCGYVYLATWFLCDYNKLKETKEAALTKNKRKGPKNTRTTDQEKSEQEQNAINQASNQTLKLLLESVLKKNIQYLWPDNKIDEEFVKCFLKTGFDMLQHSQSNYKFEDQKALLFELLQNCMSKYGGEIKYMMSQNIQKIIDLLYNQENLAVPMAEFVALCVGRQGAQIAGDIIRDLTKQIFNSDSSHESIGIKNIAKFLSKLSKLSPKVVYNNISCLLGFFDCESYLLRQSLIKILANTIQYVFNPRAALEDNAEPSPQQSEAIQQIYQQTMHKFLELLLKRFHDKSAFCRIKVMKVFTKLISENLIPQWMYMDLFKSVIGRLKDTGVQVRKTALRLFQDMLIVCGWIFGVDMRQGQKFQSIEDVIKEYEDAEQNFIQARQLLAQNEINLNMMKQSITCENPGADHAQLSIILGQHPQFQEQQNQTHKQHQIVTDSENIKNTFYEYSKFLRLMNEAGRLLKQMLSSKTIQDTVEVIRCYKLLNKYGLSFAGEGLRKMLTLVFSKDIQVAQQVIETYHNIYFGEVSVQEKVKNLFYLMKDCTLTDFTCLEEMLARLLKENSFEKEVFSTLWMTYLQFGTKFKDLNPNTPLEERKRIIAECKHEQRSSIQLLRMIGSTKIEVLLEQKEKLYENMIKFAKYESPDFTIMKEAVLAFQQIMQHQIKQQIGGQVEQAITENDRRNLYTLMSRIVATFGTADLEWFCVCETVLNCLFSLRSRLSHEYAKIFIDQIVSRMFRQRTQEELENLQFMAPNEMSLIQQMPLRSDVTDVHFSQLFFVVGHIAIKMLTYVEILESELKQALSNSFNKKKNEAKEGDEGDEAQADDGKKQEDDLAQITGGKEAEVEQYTQMLHEITENRLIQEGLIGKFIPLVLSVANEALVRYTDREAVLRAPTLCIVERSAILALCKICCVSSKICARHLDLLFSIVKSHIEFGVKANIIITLADMFNRFPNQMNERVKDIFELLHDRDILVRQQALMVITHLILNDMLKLRGEIVDICMLLEDQDERIRDQVKLFLLELHSKGQHIIYNLFPKAITRLSKEFEKLSKEEFENIAKNLIAYIKQDKQVETLIEKLCQKLKNSPLPIEWRNTAFCLTQLKITDKMITKLLEFYDLYKERLIQCAEVKEYFLVVVQNAKKFMKPEMKAAIEELELKVNLDESAQLQLKENNQYLNAKEQLQKLKKGRKQQASEVKQGPRESNQKQSRAQFETQNLQLNMEQMQIQQQTMQAQIGQPIQQRYINQDDPMMEEEYDDEDDY